MYRIKVKKGAGCWRADGAGYQMDECIAGREVGLMSKDMVLDCRNSCTEGLEDACSLVSVPLTRTPSHHQGRPEPHLKIVPPWGSDRCAEG
jgi:hypothetical protein